MNRPGRRSTNEIAAGSRFAFGDNWRNFLTTLDEERIQVAETSLVERLDSPRLDGKHFLDIGSGSGLFSLAARRLGATVRSLDYDPASVACTQSLRDRFFPDDDMWTVECADVLDGDYMAALGEHDVVYSWGVLHHTGAMWQAFEHVAPRTRVGGQLFISIYSDQGASSRRWRAIKRFYNRSSPFIRYSLVVGAGGYFGLRSVVRRALSGNNPLPSAVLARREQSRGMSVWHDLVDWVGGYPFEVATPDAILEFFRGRGYSLEKLALSTGHGCNEYVFRRLPAGRELVSQVQAG